MRTYVSHVQVNSGDIMPIGPTLYGVCNTSPAILTKRVSLSMFDRLVHGVTVAIKFTYGNTAVNNVKLQVADTLAFPILGDCTCGSNEVISFTFEELDVNNKYWHAHTSGLSDNIKNYIINQINTSTDTPDVFIMKGTIGIGGNPGSLPTSGYEIGWAYRVISDGTYAGQGCKTGELIIAIANATPNQTSVNADHWMIVPAKLDSVVVGPDYAHDGHIALFDGPTGERIKESPYTIEASVPGNAVFTDTTYTAGTGLQLDTDTNEFSVQFGDTANTVTQGNDPRLSNAREPLSHNHGNINNDGTLKFDTPVVNALLKIDSHKKIAAGPTFSANDSNKFLNEQGTWVPVVLTINNTLTPDNNGNVTITAASLGLEQGIRFIGSVAANSPYKPSDETAPTEQTPLVINGLNSYTPQPGDIIIDHEDNKEYIYTGANWWEQFGQDGSFKILQTAISKPIIYTTDYFVQSISQNENGELTVTYAQVESITGNATTATTLKTPREIYVDLSQSRDSSNLIKFNGSADIAISVNGILPIEHGGTGTSALSPNQILLTNNAQTATKFITHAYIDNATVIALSTSDSFITERTVYYGLPYINHNHAYTSNDDFYMPNTSGSASQILISGGTNSAPIWATEAKIHETITNNILTCTLELGNANTSQEGAIAEGQIKLYSSGIGAHIIKGVTNSTNVEHILPAAGGIIIQMPAEETTVGSRYQPVYVDTNGIITAITYDTNRIYYSANGNNYIASGHYIDDDKIIINFDGLNTNEIINETLYVNGDAATTGDISVGGDAAVGNHLTVIGNTAIGGNTTIGGITSITDDTDAEETNEAFSGALVVAGGASITKKLIVGGHASFRATAEVRANMSIGLELESNPDYILTIKHSTKAIKILGANDAAAYMDINTDTNTQTQVAHDYLIFIPNTDTTGYIGTTEHRWKEGHFSDLLRIGEANSDGVTIENNGTVTIASSSSSDPSCIILKSVNTSVADWVLQNTNGIFELSDSENVNLIGNASGFELQSHLYINPDNANNNSLDLYVNGRTQLTGHVGIGITPDNVDALTINGNTTIVDSNGNAIAHLNIETIDNVQQANFFPSITETGILGQGGNTPYRWGKLYIGSADEYGDSYAPIYWHDGVPTPISGIVQYHLFTIAANSTSVTIYSDAYTADTFVLLTVVISGESTLTAPIDWESNNGSITLRTATVTANVSGYILTARGCTAP